MIRPDEPKVVPHDLRPVFRDDDRMGLTCNRCGRTAFVNDKAEECAEGEAELFRQLGESCPGLEVDET